MDLEKINYAEDTGTQAIQKLDRNQRKIADEPSNLQEQINVCLKNKGLNSVDNIDSETNNVIVGFSEEGHGTYAFPGWNNIIQFSCEHFLTQLAFDVNNAYAKMALRTRWAESDFHEWTQVGTIKNFSLVTLNGWKNSTTNQWQELELTVIGGIGFLTGVITSDTSKTSEHICTLPIKPVRHFKKEIIIGSNTYTIIADNGGNVYIAGGEIPANFDVAISECIGRVI